MTELILYTRIVFWRIKMSVKLCLLRTGETVIGDLKEVIDPEANKALGYKISNPYTVAFEFRNTLKVEEEQVEESFENNSEIKFYFWAPLSADRDFNFPYEFIDVIYQPHKEVIESYNKIVNHYIDENTVTEVIDGENVIVTYNEDLEQSVIQENRIREEQLNLEGN